MVSMVEVTNFEEAHAALRRFYGKHATGPYTLDRMFELLAAVGNPQDKLRAIHVAGTSGKTSTAYFIASLLRETGAKVGLTVSPHVDEANERVQINLQPLPEAEFCSALSEFLNLVEASDILPSYFEAMVAFAYWEFARQEVDYAVVEVGLGGLLDGTNTITRADKVCVITDIGLDHTELLGDTVEKIAAQKAGIIQLENDVFMHEQAPGIMAVVQGVCDQKTARLHIAETNSSAETYGLPQFQIRNFALASTVVSFVNAREGNPPLDPKQVKDAARVYIPARMEVLRMEDKTLIIDGAHNAQKLETLFSSIRAKFADQPIAVLAGFVEGDRTRLAGALDVITDYANHLIVTSFYSEKDFPRQSVALEDIVSYCQQRNWQSVEPIESPADALAALRNRPEPLLVVCGSFYLLNHIRPLLQEGK